MKTLPGSRIAKFAADGSQQHRLDSSGVRANGLETAFQFGSNLTSGENIHLLVLDNSALNTTHHHHPHHGHGGPCLELANTCEQPRLVTVLLRATQQKAAKLPTYNCFAIDMNPVGISCPGPFLIANGSCVMTAGARLSRRNHTAK